MATTYVLIDCPPSLNLLTVNALAAADAVLVPLQCEFFALEGLAQLLSTIEEIRVRLNPKLQIHGVVLTMYDQRTSLSDQVVDDVRRVLGEKVYDDHHPAQCARGRVAVAREAGAALRLSLLRQPGLHSARLRGDRARAADACGVMHSSAITGRRLAMAVGAQKRDWAGARVADRRSVRDAALGRRRGAAHRSARGAEAWPVQSAAELRRGAARGARRLDPRARAGAAARGPAVTRATPTRSSPASAAGARRSSPSCTTCRWSSARSRDQEAIEIAIIENVQREDLNAIEEGEGYKLLMDGHGYTQEDLAKVIGKSRSHLANTLRLLKLPDSVQDLVRSGALSAGHARALIGRADAAALAARIVKEGLTVREVEALTQERAPAKPKRQKSKDADTSAAESELHEALGLDVEIKKGKGEKGELRIRYATLDQLEDVRLRLLRRPSARLKRRRETPRRGTAI